MQISKLRIFGCKPTYSLSFIYIERFLNKNGSINRDKYKDVNDEITYILKDDMSINATMSVVSVGKWYKIKYTENNKEHLSMITIIGPNEIFVTDD